MTTDPTGQAVTIAGLPTTPSGFNAAWIVPVMSATGGNTYLTPINIVMASGAPTASAPVNSLYLRSDGTTATSRIYINTTGSTAWFSVLCATS